MNAIDVLVVEDDPGTRTLLVEILRDAGYTAMAAPDGASGLAHAERLRPRLILLDLWMPVMNGWQFSDHYRGSPGPHAAMVLLSAHRDVPEATEQLGAFGFVRKPFHLDQRLEVVGRAARRSDQRVAPRHQDLALVG